MASTSTWSYSKGTIELHVSSATTIKKCMRYTNSFSPGAISFTEKNANLCSEYRSVQKCTKASFKSSSRQRSLSVFDVTKFLLDIYVSGFGRKQPYRTKVISAVLYKL